ncbi:hypothetical protein ACH49_18260 [Streptomyces leeuwenhoekii]|uniref:Uncharacterized protein n=1 Tax=Streptomyces leeuwenhoekii TaxID=1437453 RepID=A0ABR5HWS1_STRLW|nr:hypothetical protein ACH49_18260 [Streptomyces leeuwenhoekii]
MLPLQCCDQHAESHLHTRMRQSRQTDGGAVAVCGDPVLGPDQPPDLGQVLHTGFAWAVIWLSMQPGDEVGRHRAESENHAVTGEHG